ncbi:MAG: 2OG-Fe(II) oxygenase family protein [Nanoarchaeota archaeon]|nr:2OG-Fe(II) oxygenase family protein [Nanoarchaeota archaeon]
MKMFFYNKHKVEKEHSPFPHVVVKNFLFPKKAEAIAQALRKEVFTAKDSDLFKFRQTKEIASSKNRVLQEFYHLLQSAEMLKYIEQLTTVKGLRSIDMSGFIYSDTDYLLCHDDRLEGRKVAYIYYLSEDFSKQDGGALQLFSSKNKHPSKIAKKILPTFNALMVFPVTPVSFHQVQEIMSKKERLTLAGWFHG